MNEKAEEKLESILDLIEQRKDIEKQIAELLGEGESEEEEELPPPVAKKAKSAAKKGAGSGRGNGVCGNCGKPGHRRTTCTAGNKSDDMSDLKDQDAEDSDSDEELADEIREMWKGTVSSLTICNTLNINLSKFNRLIGKFNISKQIPNSSY